VNIQSLIKTAFYKAGYSIKRIRKTPRASTTGHPWTDGTTDVMQLLHKSNPYDGFDFRSRPFDGQGWGGESSAFRELIAEVKPRLIVEVGTWKGASALQMAAVTRELDLPAQIVCIDTWLGALEFWTDQSDPARYLSLQLQHGYPSVYYQFLANVCHCGFQDRVVPFPQTASIAALWFRYYGLVADLVYLDASHEEEDVYRDLWDYWAVVADDGVLLGDDYSWDGVRLAVERFAREERRPVAFVADKWVLRKQA
jgi:Methyltransferase domain